MSANPAFSLNPLDDVHRLFAFQFMRSALAAGTLVAILAAIAGWYMVLRRQAFAGHTLSVMAFPGATGAALLGLPGAVGYYLACGAAALAMGGARSAYRRETATIGAVQTAGLALGFLFLSLNRSVLGGPETLLFGTFLGITPGQVLSLLIVAVVTLAALATICRPLLLASVDRDLANARGLPVTALDAGFLMLLALAVAAATQITGALLVFALLVAPPASAQLLTMRPGAGLALSVSFGVLVVWLGLGIAYFSPYPPGFFTTTVATAIYGVARLVHHVRR